MNKKLSIVVLGVVLIAAAAVIVWQFVLDQRPSGEQQAAEAKTLVFCSEGSPEGFNPQFYTAGTTFDVSSRQIYNRLVTFTTGTHTIEPPPATPGAASENRHTAVSGKRLALA